MMSVFRTAFSQQQIVPAVFFIDMRTLRIATAKTRSQMVDLAQLLSRRHVNLTNLDIALLPQEIAFVIIKE